MTPTPEMIALAERIADDRYRRGSPSWHGAYDAALTAIMETSEKAADLANRYGYSAPQAIRNGEHLK